MVGIRGYVTIFFFILRIIIHFFTRVVLTYLWSTLFFLSQNFWSTHFNFLTIINISDYFKFTCILFGKNSICYNVVTRWWLSRFALIRSRLVVFFQFCHYLKIKAKRTHLVISIFEYYRVINKSTVNCFVVLLDDGWVLYTRRFINSE